jgi:hypothetical protein
VNITHKILLLASSVGILSGVGYSQTSALAFDFQANSSADYRQGPAGVAFESGVFSFNVRDGNFVYDGCHSAFFYNPSIPCPIGATGFVSRGLDNDPLLRGLGPYFSVTEIAPAIILRPFDPQKAVLVAAPPSLLPRPLIGFENRSLSVFYNLRTDFIRQYDLTIYNFQRGYTAAERNRFDGEVVPGTYQFNFPALAHPINPVVLKINMFPKLDGYRKINNQPQGLRFLNVTYDPDGFARLDPFALNFLKWEGNTVSFIAGGLDIAYISIKRLLDPTNPLSPPDPLSIPIFPNFSGPNATRVLLPSPLDTQYIIPPGFLQPGNTGLIDLEFIIYRPTSNLIFERATRRIRLPVRVTNPFAGAMLAAIPPGSTAQMVSADEDFDGDSVSNFAEWVFGSDPADPTSVPTSPGIQYVASANVASANVASADVSSGEPLLMEAEGETSSNAALEYRVPKLTETVPALRYAIEFSEDMVTWNEIKANDPAWKLVNGYNEIKVTSTEANDKSGGFFRTKVQVAK